jgi:CNT family concentrative nucleoside transporter
LSGVSFWLTLPGMSIYNLLSLVGVVLMPVVAWGVSSNRRRVNWRVLGWGVGLQLLLGAVIFSMPGARHVFAAVNDAAVALISAGSEGQRFLFGRLAQPPGKETSLGFYFAFQVLPIIIFFAALMQLLYYLGLMQRVIQAFAWCFTRLMRISGAESLCVASNIFVGIESATAIRPYLANMTRSELCVVLTAGMATVASSVLAAYVGMLHHVFPGIAGHLISATLLSAPAAIVMAKLLVPEEQSPATLGQTVKLQIERDPSAMEAIINGAMAGLRMVGHIAALLIAFLGLVAVINLGLQALGAPLNDWLGADVSWTLQSLLGWMFTPFALVMGVPPADAPHVGQLLGQRLVLTEAEAYPALAEAMRNDTFVHPRSAVIAAYALCGFAHVASLAIFVGGVAALVPERRHDLARLGPRALLAATLACLMTGAVAGVFFQGGATGLTPAGG